MSIKELLENKLLGKTIFLEIWEWRDATTKRVWAKDCYTYGGRTKIVTLNVWKPNGINLENELRISRTRDVVINIKRGSYKYILTTVKNYHFDIDWSDDINELLKPTIK